MDAEAVVIGLLREGIIDKGDEENGEGGQSNMANKREKERDDGDNVFVHTVMPCEK